MPLVRGEKLYGKLVKGSGLMAIVVNMVFVSQCSICTQAKGARRSVLIVSVQVNSLAFKRAFQTQDAPALQEHLLQWLF